MGHCLPAIGKTGLLAICFTMITACAFEATPTTSTDAMVTMSDDSSTTTVTTATTTTAPKVDSSSTTTTTTEPEAGPMPWTYEGTVLREQTYTADFGARGSNTAINEDHIILTLLADGSSEGFYTRRGNSSVFECSDPAKAGQIYPGTGDDETSPISWTHNDGEIIRNDGALIGTYDAAALYLTLSYSNTINLEGCFDGTFNLEVQWDAVVPRVSTATGG